MRDGRSPVDGTAELRPAAETGTVERPPDDAVADSVVDVPLEALDAPQVVDASVADELPPVSSLDAAWLVDVAGALDLGSAGEAADAPVADQALDVAALVGFDGGNVVSLDGGGVDGVGSEAGASGERIWVYLMAGQSNMVGVGKNGLLSPDEAALVPGASIYLAPSAHPNPQVGRWYPMGPGFGAEPDRFGPELTFARQIRQRFPRRRIAVIKVAEGSTGLYDRWRAPTAELYRLLVGTVNEQMAVLAREGRPQLAGLLWMQGESDATSLYQSNLYEQLLSELITTLRGDLKNQLLPVVAGLIATDYGWTYSAIVRDATSRVAARMGRVRAVETDDLTVGASDPAHLDTLGALRLGVRFADTLADLQRSSWHFPDDYTAVQGERCWCYDDRSTAGPQPLGYDSVTPAWSGGASGPLVGDGWMWPGATHQAELAWWVPFAGKVAIAVQSNLVDAASDGATLDVALGGSSLVSPVGVQYPTSVWFAVERSVVQGETIYFRTSSGAAHDPTCDKVNWRIDITMDVDE